MEGRKMKGRKTEITKDIINKARERENEHRIIRLCDWAPLSYPFMISKVTLLYYCFVLQDYRRC